jgi:hypothetical protein
MQANPEALHASHVTRDRDHRFDNLTGLTDYVGSVRQASTRMSVDLRESNIIDSNGSLMLEGRSGIQAALSPFSLGQLCNLTRSPKDFLIDLDPSIAAAALNDRMHGLTDNDAERSILVRRHGQSYGVSGINSLRYATVWNDDVLDMVQDVTKDGWRLAHENAAFVSDHNMFAFFVNDQDPIDDGTPDGLKRGFMISNSEVGDRSLTFMAFALRGACSNMQIFGVSGVETIRMPHLEGADRRFYARLKAELDRYRSSGQSETESLIKSAQRTFVAGGRNGVVASLRDHDIASQSAAEASYDLTDTEVDGDPRTVWGIFQGMTRYSQTIPFGDQRTEFERSAGRVMAMAA